MKPRKLSPDSALIDHTIEVFARGFSFTRSFTHPYLPEQIGRTWVVRDGPRKAGHYRAEEWISHGQPAGEMDRLARQHTRGRYGICAIVGSGESDASLRSDYKALGYRLQTTEPLMVHRLERIPKFAPPVTIIRVTTQAVADRLNRAAKSRQVLPEHFSLGAPLRQYAAISDDKIVGWVRSIVIGQATWCSNMYVHPTFRRRGIARALLAKMLRDDRAAGSKLAVLLASHAGAKLYPVVGYEQIGTLLMFKPRRDIEPLLGK